MARPVDSGTGPDRTRKPVQMTGDERTPPEPETPGPFGTPGDARDVERQFGALIDDVHRLITRIFDRRMAKLGLTRAQWRVLTFLFRQDGMTQSALADLLEMERAPLGRLIDRLEESGWVERRSDPGDKRAKRVFRTAKIDPLLPSLLGDAQDVLVMALEGVSPEARAELLTELGRVKGNLQRHETRGGHKTDVDPASPSQGRFGDL